MADRETPPIYPGVLVNFAESVMFRTIADCGRKLQLLADEFADELNLEPASLLKCHRWVEDLETFVSGRLGFMAWCGLSPGAKVNETELSLRRHIVHLKVGVAARLGIEGGRLAHNDTEPALIRERLRKAVDVAHGVMTEVDGLTRTGR